MKVLHCLGVEGGWASKHISLMVFNPLTSVGVCMYPLQVFHFPSTVQKDFRSIEEVAPRCESV